MPTLWQLLVVVVVVVAVVVVAVPFPTDVLILRYLPLEGLHPPSRAVVAVVVILNVVILNVQFVHVIVPLGRPLTVT